MTGGAQARGATPGAPGAVTTGAEPGGPFAGPRLLAPWALLVGLIALSAAGRFFDGWEEDELQHLHAAWLVSQGMVPYRDYFDHHMPLFHYLFSPMMSAIGANYHLLLLAARGAALAAAGASFWFFMRLVPREAGSVGALLAAVLLVASRYTDFLFLLRPDFCATTLLLLAVWVLVRNERTSGPAALAAGLCGGLALLFTQKALALLPAFLLWQALGAAHGSKGERAAHGVRWLLLAAGLFLPLTVLLAYLAHVGALEAWLRGPIGMASRYTQSQRAVYSLQEPLVTGYGAAVLGLAWAARSSIEWALRGREMWRGDALLGMLALLGAAGFMLTPAPTHHAYVFTTHVWLLACAVRHAIYLAKTRSWGDLPAGVRWTLGAAALASLLPLKPHNIVIAIVVWCILGWLWARGVARRERPAARVVWTLGVLALVPLLGSVGLFAERAVREPVWPQLAAMRVIDGQVPAGSKVLTTWAIVTPARPHATFHWFSDSGMFSALPPGAFDSEYCTALDDPRTSLVVCDPRTWQQYVPRAFAHLGDGFVEFRLAADQERALKGLRVYVRTISRSPSRSADSRRPSAENMGWR